jgi:hypothetical protein
MFEYTALVDAPVQRFTGIVTGADPLDELAPMPPSSPALMPETLAAMPETLSATPDPVRVAADLATMAAGPERAGPEHGAPDRTGPEQPRPRFHTGPALFGIAMAGITAMWLLRRESHGRTR